MNSKGNGVVLATTVFAAVAFLVVSNVAMAYPNPGTDPTAGSTYATTSNAPSFDFGQSFGNLVSPFTNFFNSMRSSGNVSVGLPVPPAIPGGNGQNIVKNLFQQLDDWIYAHTNFRISGLFLGILSIFSWILGLVKGVVDWLLSALR